MPMPMLLTLPMSTLQRTDSQETLLPSPTRASTESKATESPYRSSFFSESGDDDFSKPSLSYAYAAHTPSHLESQITPRSPRSSSSPSAGVFSAIRTSVWYMRMLLLLTLLSTLTSLATSAVTLLFGMVLGFLWLRQPYAGLPLTPAISAGALGSSVFGPCIGMLFFLRMVWRRARTTSGERQDTYAMHARETNANVRDGLHTRSSQWRSSQSPDASEKDEDEPLELWWAFPVAIVAGAFAMAVGFALMPTLLDAVNSSAEAGKEGAEATVAVAFTVKHAVIVGVWGLCVPFVPCALGALVSTLWKCDPGAGAECVMECCARGSRH